METSSPGPSHDARPQTSTGNSEHNDSASIDHLPNEVLEYIFKLISPYKDFSSCYRVCRRWRDLCILVCRFKLISFHNQISQGELLWKTLQTDESQGGVNVSKRYSHSAVFHSSTHSMFVFGGCTSTSSTFNDLLQFDLDTRSWSRPRAIGTYPSPKALASMICSEDNLILFGGWTHPSNYPLHQTWKLFNELHFFDINESRWSQILPDPDFCWPPPSAGHSATLHGKKMVVFGGLQKERAVGFFNSSDNLWVLNVETKLWEIHPVVGEKRPSGRYDQSQVYIDDAHLLVMGGCAGASKAELTDVWLLQMKDGDGWRWVEMRVEGIENRGKDIWRHPACRISKDRVVVLGRSRVNVKKTSQVLQAGSVKMSVPAPHHTNRNAIGNVPSRNNSGYSTSSSSEEGEPSAGEAVAGPSRHGAGASRWEARTPPPGKPAATPRQKMLENRQRQLASLNRMEERIRNTSTRQQQAKMAPAASPPVLCPNHRMALSVLDISRAVSDHVVTWLPPSPLLPGPEVPQESILYSLVKGRTELVLFGGLKKDISLGGSLRDLSQSTVSNSLYILYPYIDRI